MNTQSARFAILLMLGCFALVTPRSAAGQPPPIHGWNRTIALPDSVDKFYSDVNKILVKSSDGIERLVHTPDTDVHVTDSLDSLTPGTRVVVHYFVDGIQASGDGNGRLLPDGSSANEGVVMSVDPHNKRIAVRLADGTLKSLRTTHHGVADSDGRMVRSRVIVYHADGSGRRIVRYFKPAGH
jgi:hypothetical protein